MSIRRAACTATASCAILLVTPGTLSRWDIAWRTATATAGVWLFADAAVSIAFLTRGAGTARTSSTRISLESVLLLVPLCGVLGAPYPFAAVVSLGCLALVTAEARRAGALCVRWIDDSDDNANEEATVWRALVVFATFQAAQGLAAQLLALPGTALDAQLQLGIAYAASAIVLLLLTAQAERGSLRIWPARRATLLLGAMFGLVTGGLALAYVALLRHFDVLQLPSSASGTSVAGRVVVGVSVVLLAPLAEEVFFRGWLQSAIDRHRAGSQMWLAPVVTAFAFAAVHPPLSFAPVLALGMATGFLFARGGAIAPGIAAHLVHNAIALGLASRL